MVREILEKEISRRDFVKLLGAAALSGFFFRAKGVKAAEAREVQVRKEEIDFLDLEALERTQNIPELTRIAREKTAPLMRSSSTIC